MPKDERIRFTREELYEFVWSKPMTTIAAEFGMSSVAFAKHCRKLDVPIPWRGYWQRVVGDHRTKRTALPKARATTPSEIEIVKYPAPAPQPDMPVPVVVVAERLAKPHPAVVQIRDQLRRPDGKERSSINGNGHAVFRVAVKNRQRAFLILDALFKAFEAVHASVTFTETSTNGFAIKVNIADRPPVELWMTEHLKRSPHVATADEKSWGALFVRKYDYAHSGELLIEIDAPYAPDGIRRRWSDSSKTPLEDKLGDLVVGVHRAADALQAREDEWRRRRQLEEEKRNKELEAARRREHHEALARDLRDMANRWKEAMTLRAFVDAVENDTPADARSSDFSTWVAWARTYAAQFDPLMRPTTIAKRVDPPKTD